MEVVQLESVSKLDAVRHHSRMFCALYRWEELASLHTSVASMKPTIAVLTIVSRRYLPFFLSSISFITHRLFHFEDGCICALLNESIIV